MRERERENPLSNRYNWIDKIWALEKVWLFWFVFCFWEKGIRKGKFHNWNVRLFWCSNVKKMSHEPEVKSEIRSIFASTLGIGLYDPSYQHVMPFCTNATILPFLFLEHLHPNAISHLILLSKKATLSIISYHFTIHPTSQNSIFFSSLLKYSFLLFFYYFFLSLFLFISLPQPLAQQQIRKKKKKKQLARSL